MRKSANRSASPERGKLYAQVPAAERPIAATGADFRIGGDRAFYSPRLGFAASQASKAASFLLAFVGDAPADDLPPSTGGG